MIGREVCSVHWDASKRAGPITGWSARRTGLDADLRVALVAVLRILYRRPQSHLSMEQRHDLVRITSACPLRYLVFERV